MCQGLQPRAPLPSRQAKWESLKLESLRGCAMIQEELGELCDAAKTKIWGECLLELVDVLYLACNLTQEAGLETVLSGTFSLKHAARRRAGPVGKKPSIEPTNVSSARELQLQDVSGDIEQQVYRLCEW